MTARVVLAVLRLGFAGLTIAAIITQLANQIDRGASVVNFLAFFTIESNILGAAVFLYLGVRPLQGRSRRTEVVRGAAVVALATTGVVFALLLSGSDVALPIPWVNAVLHQVMPIVIVLDWLVDPPADPIPMRQAVWWLAFPLVWAIVTMIRGPIVDWYPYPFLDPGLHGVIGVAGYVAGIAVFIVVMIAGVHWVGNARSAGVRPSALA